MPTYKITRITIIGRDGKKNIRQCNMATNDLEAVRKELKRENRGADVNFMYSEVGNDDIQIEE